MLVGTLHTRPPSLIVYIAMYGDQVCKDPRDKIYGLMGLVEERERVVIDCHKSINDVFLDGLQVLHTKHIASPQDRNWWHVPLQYLGSRIGMADVDYQLVGTRTLLRDLFDRDGYFFGNYTYFQIPDPKSETDTSLPLGTEWSKVPRFRFPVLLGYDEEISNSPPGTKSFPGQWWVKFGGRRTQYPWKARTTGEYNDIRFWERSLTEDAMRELCGITYMES